MKKQTVREEREGKHVLGEIYTEIENAIEDIQDVLDSISKLEKEIRKENQVIYELINQSYERSTDSVKRLNRVGNKSKRGRLRGSGSIGLRKKGKARG